MNILVYENILFNLIIVKECDNVKIFWAFQFYGPMVLYPTLEWCKKQIIYLWRLPPYFMQARTIGRGGGVPKQYVLLIL